MFVIYANNFNVITDNLILADFPSVVNSGVYNTSSLN